YLYGPELFGHVSKSFIDMSPCDDLIIHVGPTLERNCWKGGRIRITVYVMNNGMPVIGDFECIGQNYMRKIPSVSDHEHWTIRRNQGVYKSPSSTRTRLRDHNIGMSKVIEVALDSVVKATNNSLEVSGS